MDILQYKLLSEDACSPTRGSEYAAGIDIKSSVDVTIPAGDKVMVSTDLQVLLPEGCYGRLASRSGLANNYFVFVIGGVIDRDYTGPIRVVLVNLGNTDFRVNKGDRIAQLICEKIISPIIQQVQSIDNESKRGECGFGSTGMR